jgi:hypothetical protein
MFITLIKAKDYNKKMKLDTWSKRTQTNPIYIVFIRIHSWLNSKQSQNKPNQTQPALSDLSAEASAKAEAESNVLC